MRTSALALALCLVFASAASAADDGNTQPRLTSSNLNSPNSAIDIIATTNGTGNVKGVQCDNTIMSGLAIEFYINGGSAQTISLANYGSDTGWIPMNLRFTSSIRVRMMRALSPVVYGDTPCTVSWALD
ncbi:MAG TPA: hypothetical protein VGF48_12930 [Thermoanaerobaculia bacterium]|jgi:outer membrane protein W